MIHKRNLNLQVQDNLDNKTKPVGSLGRLESLALQVALAQQTDSPRMADCALIIFIADHGVTAEGISAFPQAVTTQMAANFLHGGAAANVFAEVNGINVQLVDAGMLEPLAHPQLIDRRIAAGTGNFAREPAMSTAQCQQGISAGAQLTHDTRCDALCLGEMGIGNTSSASLLLHKILKLPLSELVGRGTGLDDESLQHKLQVLRKAAARTAASMPATQVLAEYGGFEIAMMTGAMLAAAADRKMILVDGFIATAAAAIAIEINSQVRDFMIFAHCSAEAGHRNALQAMQVEPLLQLQLRLGEGTGALLAWPLLKSSVAMLNDMASFADAGVSGPI